MKKIEELVYQGMVLDERGGWIPITDKLRVEKEFLHHLEQGEVLFKGKWTKMSELPKNARHLNRPEQVDNEIKIVFPAGTDQSLLAAPEETVFFSTDTIRDLSSNLLPVETESDYPPETKMLSAPRRGESASSPDTVATPVSMDEPTVVDETQIDVTFDRLKSPPINPVQQVTHETEFEETALYNIKVLKQQPLPPVHPRTTDNVMPQNPFDTGPSDDKSDPGAPPPKRNRVVVWSAVIVIIIFLLVVSIWLFW